MNSLISVIVPCYNQAQYLPEALDSVMAQTYANWECIIVNDGSPDNSEEIALNYCSRDSRFKYLKKENGGLSSARNAGLKIAGGAWIQFLDSDDYIAPEKFERSLELIAQNPSADLIVTDFKMFVDDHSKTTGAFCELKQEFLTFENILLSWDYVFNIPIHCGLFKAGLFDENPFNENLKIAEDWVMWINLFKKEVNPVYLSIPLAYYRINPNSMTTDKAFVRQNAAETYKHVLQIIPQQYVYKFTCNLIDNYRVTINVYANDIAYLKNQHGYRIEKKVKDILRKFIKKRS